MLNNLMQLIAGGMNPQQIIQNITQQNPQVQVLLNQAKQSGLSPQQYAIQFAKQNNINIQPLINLFQNKGIKL